MTTPYTIEQLIAELNLVASQRGWGAQLPTNISEILPDSQHVRLLHGDEQDMEDLKGRVRDLESEGRALSNDLDDITSERDSLCRRVEELTGEVLTLKEAARDMTA